MDDRLLMSMLHSLTDLREQRQPIWNGEAMLVAIRGQGEAGHVFHDEIRASFRRASGVEDFSDIGMFHERQGLTLGLEPGHHGAGIHAGFD